MSSRLVLIDDDADSRELFAEYLHLEGFDVDTFERAEDALEHVLRLHPDAILTDVTLAGMSGTEVAQRLRGDERTRRIPLVAVTGRLAQELREDRALFDAVFVKPVDVPSLAAALRGLLAAAR